MAQGISFPPADSITDAEFLRQTKMAADYIMDKAKDLDLNTPEGVKRLFFRFNGVASKYVEKAISMGFSQEEAQNGEGSPYVMNMFDERRDPTSSGMDPRWRGMYVADGVYDSSAVSKRPGAYTQYAAIAGGICRNDGNGNLNATALELAWPDTGHGCNAKPEYAAAAKKVGTWDYLNGCSCDRFVATVIRYSGADPNVPNGDTGTQLAYFSQHPELYQKIDNIGNTSNLQPGDILVRNGHIMMYINREDGTEGIAHASISYANPGRDGRAGEITGVAGNFNSSYSVFRFIGSTKST